MGRWAKVEEEGSEEKVTDAGQDESKKVCDHIFAKKRKLPPSRKAATIHASPVDSKDLVRKAKKKFRLARDSIAFRVKRDKKLSVNGKSRRYDDEDNKFFLTEMLKLAASGIDGHDCVRNVHIRKLYGQVRKRFGNHYSQRQVYEKARRLRRMYMMRLLTRSADQRAISENSSKEEIFNLCHQLWGDCGVLKLHLEDEDGPVCPNERLGDAASGREYDAHGLVGVVPGRDIEIDKGAQIKVDDSVPIVSSIHQDDSHGLKGVVPGKDMVVDKATPAEVDDHVPSAKDMQVCLLKNLAEKPGDEGAGLATQRLDKVIHDDNQGLLQALERKCDLVLEGMQARVMTMVSNALEARDEVSMGRLFEMLKPAGISHDDKFVGRMLTGSMHESNLSIPRHLQDRWQRLRAEELKLVSDRLRLMLEVCQSEQAKLERQIRHS